MDAAHNGGPEARKLALISLGGSLLVWAGCVLFMGALVLSGQLRQAQDGFLAQVDGVHRHVELRLQAAEQLLDALTAFAETVGGRSDLLRSYVDRLLGGVPHVQQALLARAGAASAAPGKGASLDLVPLAGHRPYAIDAAGAELLHEAMRTAWRRDATAASRLFTLSDGAAGYLLVRPLGGARATESGQRFLVLEVALAALLPPAASLPADLAVALHRNGAEDGDPAVRVHRPDSRETVLPFPVLRTDKAFAGSVQPLALTAYRQLDWTAVQPRVAVAFVAAAALSFAMAYGYGLGRARREAARRSVEMKLYHMANYDSLTGLPNRNLFKDRLQRALVRARRNSTCMALCFIDLDGFKAVNDSAGHDTGDRLLQLVARRLSTVVRASDTIARLAGDEFVVVLEEVGDCADVQKVTEKIRDAFADVFVIGDFQFLLTASIGIAVYPEDGNDATQLLRRADTRMYAVKYPEWAADASPSDAAAPADIGVRVGGRTLA